MDILFGFCEQSTMDPFDGMDLFARVVEAGSFTNAAKSLGLGKSSVSEKVAALEARIGVRLLDRTTRRLTTTEAGRIYYERAREARQQAEAALNEIEALREEPAGLLRVGVPELLTRLHLVPALPSFLSAHPRFRVEFVEKVEPQDLVKEGLDMVIRVTADPSPTTVVRRIGVSQVVIVAAPAYINRHGKPLHPTDLGRHRTIGFSPLAWGKEWVFSSDGEPIRVPITPILLTNAAESVRAGVRAGIGITAIPYWGVCDLLRSGELIRVLEDFATSQSGLYAVYPSNRLIAPKVRHYADHVAAALKASATVPK